jgi:hypothetical protein
MSAPAGATNTEPGQETNPERKPISMHKRTDLSAGNLNGADRLSVELIEPTDLPAAILIRWPEKPSITTPDAYANVAAAAMQILAGAVVELATIRVWKKKL